MLDHHNTSPKGRSATTSERAVTRSFYKRIKKKSVFDSVAFREHLTKVDRDRVHGMGQRLSTYLEGNVPAALEGKSALSDYKTNPYVIMTSAISLKLTDVEKFAWFLFGSKFYAGLETSFGKSVETELLQFYPSRENHWTEPPEKMVESNLLKGLGDEEKARRRVVSVWREIDQSLVVGDRRFLLTVKSGPNCINDTQVDAMQNAIASHHAKWLEKSKQTFRGVEKLDIVIGLTYGTDRTTNNKENQILVKLLERGFHEADPVGAPGVLTLREEPDVRVYRVVGQDFWATVGAPLRPSQARHVFLEILLGLLSALHSRQLENSMEAIVNRKLKQLSEAIAKLTLPNESLPEWMKDEFGSDDITSLISGASSFYDEGI